MKKLLITLLLLSGMHSYAQEIKTAFIPHIVNEKQLNGTFGQDQNGGFVCYGKITQVPNNIFTNSQASFVCDGKKVEIATHVQDVLKGAYLGSNFLNYNPRLYYSRGAYSLDSDITGIIVYYR